MKDEHFEHLMRDAAATFNRPPEPPLDEMWEEIEGRGMSGEGRDAPSKRRRRFPLPSSLFPLPALIAATLIIGIGLGRASKQVGGASATIAAAVAQVHDTASHDTPDLAEPYQLATSEYLGQTAALLVALPAAAKRGSTDDQFTKRAGELLTTTRLLLDSPAGQDERMRALLEDLELVLAQVVRLQDTPSRTDLDLIHQALEQRDVIPRLRTAAADLTAND